VQAAQARQADALDAAVSPQERERLLKEQREFYGDAFVERPQLPGRPGSEVGGRTGGTAGSAGSAGPAGTEGRGGSAGPAEDSKDSKASGSEDAPQSLDTSGRKGADGKPSQLPPTQDQIEFFREREHWISPSGDVWHVQVTDDDEVLVRREGVNGMLASPGIPVATPAPERPADRKQKPGAGKEATETGERESATSQDSAGATDGERHALGCGCSNCLVDRSSTVRRDEAEARFAAVEQEATGLPPVSQVPRTGDEGGLGRLGGGDIPRPEQVSSTGFFMLEPSGRGVTSIDTTQRYADGVSVRMTTRQSSGPESEHIGRQATSIVTAERPDGSQARVYERVSLGSFARSDEGHDSRTLVTLTDASGRRTTTDSTRPSTRETPTTLEELRVAQVELGRAYQETSAPGAGIPRAADAAFEHAQQAMARIDRDELQDAVLRGGRHLAGEGPDAVAGYADQLFDDVRDRFRAFGLDAADGNELIDREWYQESLRENAYYARGSDRMVFGVGADGEPISAANDVIAHEFTHRLIESNGGITYRGQSGAVNESIADAMAAAVDQDDWLLGEDAFDRGVRDMSRRATMDDYVETTQDNGGVHINSAIPNHAAYLIGEELGRDHLGEIYARTIQQHITPDMQFTDLAVGTWRSAVELYGADSSQAAAVQQAWDAVLLLDGNTSLFTPAPGSGGGGGGGSSW
jgi:hypothetical protein